MAWDSTVIRIGLSPRVRGNHFVPNREAKSHRSIPACAGEPTLAIGEVVGVRVYPRVCGGTSTSTR